MPLFGTQGWFRRRHQTQQASALLNQEQRQPLMAVADDAATDDGDAVLMTARSAGGAAGSRSGTGTMKQRKKTTEVTATRTVTASTDEPKVRRRPRDKRVAPALAALLGAGLAATGVVALAGVFGPISVLILGLAAAGVGVGALFVLGAIYNLNKKTKPSNSKTALTGLVGLLGAGLAATGVLALVGVFGPISTVVLGLAAAGVGLGALSALGSLIGLDKQTNPSRAKAVLTGLVTLLGVGLIATGIVAAIGVFGSIPTMVLGLAAAGIGLGAVIAIGGLVSRMNQVRVRAAISPYYALDDQYKPLYKSDTFEMRAQSAAQADDSYQPASDQGAFYGRTDGSVATDDGRVSADMYGQLAPSVAAPQFQMGAAQPDAGRGRMQRTISDATPTALVEQNMFAATAAAAAQPSAPAVVNQPTAASVPSAPAANVFDDAAAHDASVDFRHVASLDGQ